METVYYTEPTSLIKEAEETLHFFKKLFKRKPQPPKFNPNAAIDLSIDGLNPMLAKQLSEVEAQLGRLAQVQFEMASERKKMQLEMNAILALHAQPQAKKQIAPPPFVK